MTSWKTDIILKLLDAGMNVARFNFSHGEHKVNLFLLINNKQNHLVTLTNLREALKERPHLTCAVMLDTKVNNLLNLFFQGPEIRTGFFENNMRNVDLVKDQMLEISIKNYF